MAELGEVEEVAEELIRSSLDEQGEGGQAPPWAHNVGVATLLMALATAFGGLFAGITAHESMMERTEQIVDLSEVQSERLEVEVLASKHELLRSMGGSPDELELKRVAAYKEEAGQLNELSDEDAAKSLVANSDHLVFAVGVTLISVAISLCGMSIVVRRLFLYRAGVIIAAGGGLVIALGLYRFLN